MIAQKSKSSSYTVQPKDGRFQVFDKDQKFRCSFTTDAAARAFIAAQECAAHAKAKRTVAQVAAGVALALALLLPAAPVQAGTWRCGPWRYFQVVHHVAGDSHTDWRRTRDCWYVK